MKRYTMFLDWKNQCCENDYTTPSNLQIQCNPYQISISIFQRTRTKNLKICMETQKTGNSQRNLVLNKFIYSFIYFWLRWVFVAARGLSVVVASRGYSSLWCMGFSLQCLLLLWSKSSRHMGFCSCGTRA